MKNQLFRSILIGLGALSVSTILPDNAQAQGAKPLEEIIVTATKRGVQTAQNVPISISAFSEDFLKDKRVDASISKYRYPHSNFMIIGHGRLLHERSAVLIEDSCYVGFGFFDPVVTGSDVEAIKLSVKAYHNNPDVSRIILSYMRKYRKRVTILEYDLIEEV